MKACCYALAVVLAVAGTALAAEHTDDSLDKVQRNLAEKKALLIDVREPDEWKRGHLKQAQLVPLSELKQMSSDPAVRAKVEKNLSKERIIYCHCASGFRVLSAADILGKLGYDVRPLSSGFSDLQESGFPVAEQP
ncbi:MAG: rhodanese-like domain-containing protein [Planctomycetota bacterium]|nr:MAG: rhodanese-like domain-containing protein [Planctomycetota bacterium]